MSKNRKSKYFKRFMLISVVFLIILMISPAHDVQAFDTDGDGLDNDTVEDVIAIQFSPILHFTAGENFYPIDANHSIATSELWHWPGPVQDADPAEGTLTGLSDQYFLKSKLGTYENIKEYFTVNRQPIGYKVYTHVGDYGGNRILQYWFFYPYNDGPINQHEGDWEMIQITLDTSNVPISAQYSQHHGGETAAWAEVEKTGDHPHVYVARGSHANYFRSYQGKVGLESDEVSADGLVISDSTYTLENMGEQGTPLNGNGWINYQGRWGNWENFVDASIGFAGPLGPRYQGSGADDKWGDPNAWTASLFVVDTLWFALCWFMYYLLYIILAIFAIFVIRKVYKIFKLNSKGGLLLGEVLKTRASVGILFGVVGIGMTIAAIFLPWYVVNAQFSGAVTLGGDVLVMDGINGVSMNFLVTGTGMTPLFSLGIPFSMIIGMGIVLNALDIIGVDKPKKLGNGYIKSGIFFMLFVGIILLIMTQLGAIMGLFPGVPSEAADLGAAIAAAPFGGTSPPIDFFFGAVTATFTWALLTGGILLFAAAFMKIIAGFIIRSAPSEFA